MQELENHGLVGIREALRQCDSLELELRSSLDARHHVRALRQAIQRNNQISTVKFHLHGEWEEAGSRAVLGELVSTVAALPNLKEVVVAGAFAPFPAITTLLHHTSHLQCLTLQRFQNLKSSDSQILMNFCRALQRHKTLKHLAFKPQIDNSTCDPKEIALLQLLLEALAESPVLRQVEVQTNVACLSGPPLVKLCNSSTLSKLELRPKDEVGVDGLKALARNGSVQELVVSCQMAERCRAAVTLLLGANTTLKELTLIVPQHGTDDKEDSQRFVEAVANALRSNRTITDFKMPIGSPYPSPSSLQSFVRTFHDNCTLQTLEVFRDMSKVQQANYEDIAKMPEGPTKSALLLGKKLLYYTLLNRSGRGALLSADPSRGQWIDKLIEYNYSLDHLYFFLRMNPTLCSEELADPMECDPIINVRKRGRMHE